MLGIEDNVRSKKTCGIILLTEIRENCVPAIPVRNFSL